jgi:hypothetical protein
MLTKWPAIGAKRTEVREYRSADGEERLWYESEEIERLVEDELVRAKLMPSISNPVVDLEAFVEVYLKCALDQYRPLPAEVLGVTEFQRGQQPRISLNSDLTGSALDDHDASQGIRGRWRATLAHEACHVLLHRILFEFDDNQGELFAVPTPRSEQLLRCLKRDVGYGVRAPDWREVQANSGMGALLMPKRLFTRSVRAELNSLGKTSADLTAGNSAVIELSRRLAKRFNVSAQAARIRLNTTGYLGDPSAPPLTEY